MTRLSDGFDDQASYEGILPAPSLVAVAVAKEALARLRRIFSNSELADRIPVEVHRMGFTRILFSDIRHNTWIVRSAYTADDHQLAGAMLQVGRAHPRKLRRPLPECDMVLSGAPILIENPLSDPRLHSELVAVANPKAYVAAPVYAWQTPVGLLHADAPTKSGDVDIAERDLLGLFAEGVGAIFERNLTLARLRRLRSAVEEHTQRIGALAYAFEDELWENMDVEADTDRAGITVTGQRVDGIAAELTPRERQVLHMLATGKTNGQIADRLFITAGTVKSHMKHIMEKLGASNRTDAVRKYQAWDDAPF
jgi:DNA-binding CsgD family transcriptional regulator